MRIPSSFSAVWIGLFILAGCVQSVDTDTDTDTDTDKNWAGGETHITYVQGDDGRIAVQVSLPLEPRFETGAAVVVHANTFFTPTGRFDDWPELSEHGIIHVSLMYPGLTEPGGGSSEGEYDHGGPISLAALRDVIRYAGGAIPDADGQTLAETSLIPVDASNLGLFAFSHPGIAATRVLATHGEDLPKVSWFVGRENPTEASLSAVEVGHWDDTSAAVQNPVYNPATDYRGTGLRIDYSSVRWAEGWTEESGSNPGRPYFDLDGSKTPNDGDYILGPRIPTMYDQRVYSTELLRALEASLGSEKWPEDVMTADDAEALWAERITTNIYGNLKDTAPDLHVLLVFAEEDHVQPAPDKPHIHQAWDGFSKAAGLWVRLNPDSAYVSHVGGIATVENPAQTAPTNWLDLSDWAYPNVKDANRDYPLAAVLEMADRTAYESWATADLSAVLHE